MSEEKTRRSRVGDQKDKQEAYDPPEDGGRTVYLEYIDKPNHLSHLRPSHRNTPGDTPHGFVVGITGAPDSISADEVATQYNKLVIWTIPEYIHWSHISGLPEGHVVTFRRQ